MECPTPLLHRRTRLSALRMKKEGSLPMPRTNQQQTRRFSAEPELLSRHATAALLGDIHIRTVDRLRMRGQLDGAKIGNRMFIKATSAKRLAAGEG